MSDDGQVGAVILAAGASRRHGSPKQLVLLDGRSMLEHVVARAFEAGLAPIVAVVPVWLGHPAALGSVDLRWIRNAFPERGMSLSLRLGLAALGEDVAAALILLGDQPGVSQSTVRAVLAARGGRPIVAAEAGGVQAPPVVVERSHFHVAEGLGGDTGLRGWLSANPELVRGVPVADHAPDVDTPEDLRRLGAAP